MIAFTTPLDEREPVLFEINDENKFKINLK
jgi:hypothetical protein